MNIEQEICKRVSDVLKCLLTDVEIDGNWNVDGAEKGVGPKAGPRLEVSVSPRKYDGYTSRVAELDVTFEGAFPFADDVTFARTVEAYDTLVGRLEEWHGDISSVKRDLTVDGAFDPVGLRLSGGTMEIDRETKVRNFTQQITIKGRISK